MQWIDEAKRSIERIPDFVRGMIVEAIEAHARNRGLPEVAPELFEEAEGLWVDCQS